MAGSDIKAGGAFVEIFLKGNIGPQLDKLGAKLKSFGAGVTDIGKKTAALGAAMTAPLLLAAQQFASIGSELNDVSKRTGVGTIALQEFKYAAEQTGAGLEDVEAGVRKMGKAIFEAAEGSAGAKKALASIGLTANDLKALKPEEQFKRIVEGLNGIGDPAAKATVAMELLGKGGAKLLPMMEELVALTAHYQSLGVTFSEEDIAAADTFGDTLDDLQLQFKAIIFQVGAAVAQALQPFAESLRNCLTTIIDFAKNNRAMVISVLAVGAGLVAAGAALVTFGVGVQIVGAAIGGITTVIGAVGSAFALLTNPILLVGAGLVVLAGYFLFATETGQKAVKFLTNRFNALAETAKTAFGGIADALSAGDIGLAAQILWTGVKLAFLQGTQEIQTAWIKFKAGFVQVAAAAFYGALTIWANVKAGLLTAWEETVAVFGSVWDGFIGAFTSAWDKAVTLVAKGMNYIRGVFDGSFDVKAANEAADQILAQNEDARRAAEVARQKQREDERQKSISDIDRQRQKVVDDLNRREQDVSAGADQNAKDDIKALQDQKAALEKQLQEQRDRAAKEKKQKKDDEAALPTIDKSKLDGLDDVIARRAPDAKSQGLFNVAALQSLQGDGKIDRLVKAAEETAKNTKRSASSQSKFG